MITPLTVYYYWPELSSAWKCFSIGQLQKVWMYWASWGNEQTHHSFLVKSWSTQGDVRLINERWRDPDPDSGTALTVSVLECYCSAIIQKKVCDQTGHHFFLAWKHLAVRHPPPPQKNKDGNVHNAKRRIFRNPLCIVYCRWFVNQCLYVLTFQDKRSLLNKT